MNTKGNVKINSQLSFQVEGEDEVEVFKGIARVQELYSTVKCGKCSSDKIKYVCRKDSEENDWLELVCMNYACRAKLSYGQTKKPKGLIYPKTRFTHLSPAVQLERPECKAYADENNGWLPNNGWYIYQPKG